MLAKEIRERRNEAAIAEYNGLLFAAKYKRDFFFLPLKTNIKESNYKFKWNLYFVILIHNLQSFLFAVPTLYTVTFVP